MADPKDGVRSLFDELSATYDSTGIDFFGQIARALVARAGLSEGSTVLDVGCGAGAALLAAAEVVGPTGIGSILRAHGFHSVSIDDMTHQVEFPSLEAFHDWEWSTGSRAAWSAIPAEDRVAARTAVEGYLDSLQSRRGALRLETAVRYTRAVAA